MPRIGGKARMQSSNRTLHYVILAAALACFVAAGGVRAWGNDQLLVPPDAGCAQAEAAINDAYWDASAVQISMWMQSVINQYVVDDDYCRMRRARQRCTNYLLWRWAYKRHPHLAIAIPPNRDSFDSCNRVDRAWF
jgi:hypothetical protein